jgi:hypothetical protein
MNKRPVGLTILMSVNTLIGINVWLYMVIRVVLLYQAERSPGLADWYSLVYSFLLGLLCLVTANGFRTRRFRSGFLGGIALGLWLLIHHVLKIFLILREVLWFSLCVIHIYPIAYALVLLGLLVFRYRRQFKARGVIGETVSGELEGETTDTGEPDAPVSARFRSWQRVLIAANLLLGTMLWLGYCTDYSLRGDNADVVFIVVVALIAGTTWLLASRVRDRSLKRFARLASIPSLIGGGPYLLYLIVMLPGVLLLSITTQLLPWEDFGDFFDDNEGEETVIQSVLSPDGTRIANVHFQLGGGWGGNGSIRVQVIPRWMPFVERMIYENSGSYADENTTEYLHWVDIQTLRITGEPDERGRFNAFLEKWGGEMRTTDEPEEMGGIVKDIKVGHIQLAVSPDIVFVPFMVPYIFAQMAESDAMRDATPPFDYDEHNADLKVLGVMITVALADDYLTVQELREISDHMRKMKDYLPIPTYSQFGEQGGLVEPIRLVLVDNIITLEEEREIKKWFSFLNDFVLRMWGADT